MFTSDNPNIIKSDEGFSVEIFVPVGLCYREGDRSLYISSELLIDPYGVAIYQSSIKRWGGLDGQPIEDEERKTIVENIRRAFTYQGTQVVVI